MKRFLLVASIIVSVFFLSNQAKAQGNQTVVNGGQTTAVNFPSGGCSYKWVNNTPGIGLAANGTGDIASFTAVNNGNIPITTTITATPVPSGFAYITNPNNGTISVINTVTKNIVSIISIGTGSPWGVAVSSDGTRVYTSDLNYDAIHVLDSKTNSIISTINIAGAPRGIAVSPDGARVYVTNEFTSNVAVVNTVTNTVIKTIPVGSSPLGIAVSPDGNKVYVANQGTQTISVISTSTNTVVSTISLNMQPNGIVVSPDGSQVYVSANNPRSAVIINAATNTISKVIPIGLNPIGITMAPDGSRVYIVNEDSGSVSVIDTKTQTLITTIALNGSNSPFSISITADGSQIYVVSQDGKVFVVNTSTYAITGIVTVVSGPLSFGNFISAGIGCNSSPITFTITVQPSSVIPTITAGSATGTITACQGSPSASLDIQQFTVSGAGLTNDITVTAPPGFEVSLLANSGYSNSVIIPLSGGVVNNTIVYVRSAASATGNISGNIVLSSPGATSQNVAVLGKIKPLPTVNSVGNQIVSTGNITAAINFSGTTSDFNWVNSTPSIGLPASGMGNIPAFTAVNNGASPLTASVTVTPTNKQVYAYIPSANTAAVSVIDLVANKTIATVPVGLGPMGVAVSPDGTKVYVTNQQSGSVSVINTATNITVATVKMAFASNPTSVVVSADGSKVYVTDLILNAVLVINAATNTLLKTIAVGTYPFGIGISPDGTKVYTANSIDNTISVINTATDMVTATIPVAGSPDALSVSADGNTLYVANYVSNNVSVVNTSNNTVITSITTGAGASMTTLSPDGKLLYVSNSRASTISVINTANNLVVATIPVNTTPIGLNVSKDGTKVYVAELDSKSITVIDALTNSVINNIAVGMSPYAIGNFISETPGCDGPPATFTITVNPLSVTPTIIAGPVTGTISACEGSASVSPHVGQFTVSGNSLTNGIVATAPPGFQLSLSATGVYSNIVSIPQSGGTVNNVTIYVGLAASVTGNMSGNVTLTSSGATDKTVTVTGTVNALPAVGPIANQKVLSGSFTKEVDFTGTGNTYNWVNDNPSIGIAYGTSTSIVQFMTTNTGTVPMIGTFTVTPVNTTTGCSGPPVTFTIEVDPILPPVITETGTLSSLSTIYGTPSASTSFSVSGASVNSGILVTPPAGFEVSTDNTHFSQTVTVGSSGTITATTVYIRLTSKTPAGSYSGNVILSSSGAANVNVSIPYSIVNPAPLTITANNVQKHSDQALTNGFVSTGFTPSGLQNNETIGGVFIVYGLGADAAAQTGTYTGSVVPSVASGGSFDPKNYTITYKSGDIIVTEGVVNVSIAIPNAFTPNGDGINDVWNIKSLIDYPSCLVSIFTRYGGMIYQSRGYAKPWDGVYNGSPLPTGTYYYIINLQNGQQPLSGYVALIR